jgi:hypothetical protein
MESGALFNPGFLGAHFNWWIGQIADDSTWRDNIIPGKTPSEKNIKGWGYRYKVRIIGYHDQDPSNSVPDDQLPWAQIMYPVTAGGGQGQSAQTPNLRQGNFVFGFFLDGSEGQNPVIMGVLGNNAQTQLGTKIGEKGFVPTSGYAKGKTPDPNIKAPDHGLKVEKPSNAPKPKPGVKLDKYGRDPSRPPTTGELNAAKEARQEADRLGLTGESKEKLIAEATVSQTRKEAAAGASPTTPPIPGASLENSTGVHLTTNADVVRNDMYLKKTPLSSPCKKQKSDLKNIKIVIENLTNDINKIQQSANSYIDAVSSKLNTSSIESLIDNAASQIAKFMKSIFDQVRGYVLKEFNKAIAPAIDSMMPNARFKLIELKELATDKLSGIFNALIAKLVDLIKGLLSNLLKNPADPTGNTIKQIAPDLGRGGGGTEETSIPTSPSVPICSVESLVGEILGQTINDITTGVDSAMAPIATEMKSYIDEISTLTDSASDMLGNVSSVLGGITGNMSSALGFVNGILQFFSSDEEPSCPINDTHTLQNGGGSTEPAQEPNNQSVAKSAEKATPIAEVKPIPFASPAANSPDINFGPSTASERAQVSANQTPGFTRLGE